MAKYFMTEGEKEQLAYLAAVLAVIATVSLCIIIFAPLKVTLFIFGAILSLVFFWVLFVFLGMIVGGKIGAYEVVENHDVLKDIQDKDKQSDV